eukprot:gene4434-20670_t
MDGVVKENFAGIEGTYLLSLTLYLTRFVGFVENSLKEEEALIEDWKPEPLVPKKKICDYVVNPKIVKG